MFLADNRNKKKGCARVFALLRAALPAALIQFRLARFWTTSLAISLLSGACRAEKRQCPSSKKLSLPTAAAKMWVAGSAPVQALKLLALANPKRMAVVIGSYGDGTFVIVW